MKSFKSPDWYMQFELSYCFGIWQAHWQHCCWGACQISELLNNSKYKILQYNVLSEIKTGPRDGNTSYCLVNRSKGNSNAALRNSLTIGKVHMDGLVQDCSNSCMLALELLQSCTKPSIFITLFSTPKFTYSITNCLSNINSTYNRT